MSQARREFDNAENEFNHFMLNLTMSEYSNSTQNIFRTFMQRGLFPLNGQLAAFNYDSATETISLQLLPITLAHIPADIDFNVNPEATPQAPEAAGIALEKCKLPQLSRVAEAEAAFVDACEPKWLCDPIFFVPMTDPVCLLPSGQVMQRESYRNLKSRNSRCPITRAAIESAVTDHFAKNIITAFNNFTAAVNAAENSAAVKVLAEEFKLQSAAIFARVMPNPVIETSSGNTMAQAQVTPELPSQVLKSVFAIAANDKLHESIDLVVRRKELFFIAREREPVILAESSAARGLGFFASDALPAINKVANVKRRYSV